MDVTTRTARGWLSGPSKTRPAAPRPSRCKRCAGRLWWCSSESPVPSLPPPHLIDPHWLLEPFRYELAAVREQEPLPAAQPPHRVRYQYLPALRLRGDPRRQDHGRPEETAALLDRLAGVEADADVERLALALGECALQGDGALDGAGDAAEGRHEAVAHRLHFVAAVRLQYFAGDALVLTQDGAAALVAEAGHHVRVADEVGEEDGAQRGARRGWGRRRHDKCSRLPIFIQKLRDHTHDPFPVPGERTMSLPLKRNQARIGNGSGQGLSHGQADHTIIHTVEEERAGWQLAQEWLNIEGHVLLRKHGDESATS